MSRRRESGDVFSLRMVWRLLNSRVSVRGFELCLKAAFCTGGGSPALRCGNLQLGLLMFSAFFPQGNLLADTPDLTALTLEELLQVEVTTVSKKTERRFESPAAVYVLTQDEIRRSGAVTIPDLLRLVPGVEVGRIDSNKWFIGVRGFASRLTRSLLVLVDGRNVYSPLFAGAYWEIQDTLLEDIERIEVVLGPGGSLWGANAVNGVVNIITRTAHDTQGGLAALRGGNQERATAARYGASSGNTAWRVYGKAFDREALRHDDGNDYDAWRAARGGFRLDRSGDGADFMLQGDMYRGRSGQRDNITLLDAPYLQVMETDTLFSGTDLLARWQQSTGRSKWQVQTYYDRTVREEPSFSETRDTVDLEAQNQMALGELHELTYGAGYRFTRGETGDSPTVAFSPKTRADQLVTAFIEGDIAIRPQTTHLILGSKFEINDYSGFEWQPSLRLSFAPDEETFYWAAATRAVRTPSRIEHDLTLWQAADPAAPAFIRLRGNKDFEPETVMAVEAGHRRQLNDITSLEISLFNNRYRNLLSAESGTPSSETLGNGVNALIIPFLFGNGMQANSRGGEVTLEWLPKRNVRLSGHYAYLYVNAHRTELSTDAMSENLLEKGSPRHVAGMRARWDPMQAVEVDVDFRYMSELPAFNVSEYVTADARVSYWLQKNLELAVVGRDLLQPRHIEFSTAGATAQLGRSLFAALKWYW